MNNDIAALREKAEHAQQVAKSYEMQVSRVERDCKHEWDEAVNNPIRTEGYEYGDEIGTMGSDYRPKTWVPASTTPRWTRTCKMCGKVETTTATDEIVTKKVVPRFS